MEQECNWLCLLRTGAQLLPSSGWVILTELFPSMAAWGQLSLVDPTWAARATRLPGRCDCQGGNRGFRTPLSRPTHKVSTSKEAAEPLSQHYLSQGGFPKKIPEKKKFSFTKAFNFFYKHCSKVLKVLRILDSVGGNLSPSHSLANIFSF